MERDLAKELYLLSLLSKIVRQWHPSQIQELAYGLRRGLTQEQVLKCADTKFWSKEMNTLIRCHNLLDDDQIDELLESIKQVGFLSATKEVLNREIQKKVKDFDSEAYGGRALSELHDWLLDGFDFSELEGLIHPKYPMTVLQQVLEDVFGNQLEKWMIRKYLQVYRQTRNIDIMYRQRGFYMDGYYLESICYWGCEYECYDEFHYEEYYEDTDHFYEGNNNC